MVAACGSSSSTPPPAVVVAPDAAPAAAVTRVPEDRACRGITDQIAPKFVDGVMPDGTPARKADAQGRVAALIYEVCTEGRYGPQIVACGGQAECTDALTNGMLAALAPRFRALMDELRAP